MLSRLRVSYVRERRWRVLRRAACCVGEWRGAAVCVSLYDDTNTILRFHSTESDESSGALWCFLVGQLGGICRGQRRWCRETI